MVDVHVVVHLLPRRKVHSAAVSNADDRVADSLRVAQRLSAAAVFGLRNRFLDRRSCLNGFFWNVTIRLDRVRLQIKS